MEMTTFWLVFHLALAGIVLGWVLVKLTEWIKDKFRPGL